MLQEELQKFVLRMAAEFPNRKEQLIFLINNYDMMLAVLKVRCFRKKSTICQMYDGGFVTNKLVKNTSFLNGPIRHWPL